MGFFRKVLLAAFLAVSSAAPLELFSDFLRMKGQVDDCPINSICFVMDQSGSVGSFYPQEQQFVVEIAREISTLTKDTIFSAYGFSSSAAPIQTGTTDLEGEFVPSVNQPTTVGGSTNLFAGLNGCFNEIKGDNGNKVIVVVTDGDDNGSPLASTLAPTVKAAGISIVTVGVTNNVDEAYLKDLASRPEFFVKSPDFDMLLSMAIDVVEDTCEVVTITDEPMTPTPVPMDFCEEAYAACEFAFDGQPTVPIYSVTGLADTAFTDLIVSRKPGQKIGILNSNGRVPEFILDDGSVELITDVPAAQSFSPRQFKPFPLEGTFGSGIGHETYQQDQESFVLDKCIRVWFSSYQVLTGDTPPFVSTNVNVNDPLDNECVVFRSASS